jgi:hypothetical protein
LESELLKLCWRQGTWLSQAPNAFAKGTFSKEWEQAVKLQAEKTPLRETMEEISRIEGSPSDRIIKLGEAVISRHEEHERPMENLVNQTKTGLISAAQNGKIMSFGFDKERALETPPICIPAQFWKSRIDWSGNTIKSGALIFRDVRILSVSKFEKLQNKWHIEEFGQPTKSKSGRPSIEASFQGAFNDFNEAGMIDTENSQISHYPMFKEWFEKSPGALPSRRTTISEKVFYKYFSRMFNELKTNQTL